MMMLRPWLRRYFLYNLDVFFMYATVSIIYFFKITEGRIFVPNSLLLASAYVVGIVGVYSLNKITDRAEDTINERVEFTATKFGHYTPPVIFFVIVFFLCALLDGGRLLPYVLGISFFGIWYSLPRRYRLKNIPLVKNLVPPACWVISLSVLISASTSSFTIPVVMKFLWPLFFLASVFEIFWDIPDRKGDQATGVRTFPVLFGVLKTRMLLGGLLTIFFFLVPLAPEKIIALALLVCVIIISEQTKKITCHYALSFLMFLVILVNVLYNGSQLAKALFGFEKNSQYVSANDVLMYDYLYLTSAVGQKALTPEDENSGQEMVHIERMSDGKQVYRTTDFQNSLVFDSATFTAAEMWQGVPFRYIVSRERKSIFDTSLPGTFRGRYRMSPRHTSICSKEDIVGQYEASTDSEETAIVRTDEGEIKVRVISAQLSGQWSHCGIKGTSTSQVTYAPDLGVLIMFEETVYREGVLFRIARMKLNEIRGNNSSK